MQTINRVFGGKNFMRSALAVMWSAFAMAYIFFVTANIIPPDNIRIVDTILGFLLGTAVSSILMFYYGSSQGSSEKNDVLQSMNPAPNSSSSFTVSKTETKTEDKPEIK